MTSEGITSMSHRALLAGKETSTVVEPFFSTVTLSALAASPGCVDVMDGFISDLNQV